MKKFTQKMVLEEVKKVQAGELTDNQVFDDWMDMAGDWLANDDGEYLRHGFDGFYDRTPEQILLDFHFGGKLDRPLSAAEVDRLLETPR